MVFCNRAKISPHFYLSAKQKCAYMGALPLTNDTYMYHLIYESVAETVDVFHVNK